MDKKAKTIIGVVLFIAILSIAVGFAAITSVQLNISGTAGATASQENFKVEFTGEPEVSDGEKVEATINNMDKTNATMNVTGLTAKDEFVTATYTIKNLSADLSAQLSAKTTTSNTEYFDVTYNIDEPTTLTANGETTITVTVTLKKTPIEEPATGTIGVTITADPLQP